MGRSCCGIGVGVGVAIGVGVAAGVGAEGGIVSARCEQPGYTPKGIGRVDKGVSHGRRLRPRSGLLERLAMLGSSESREAKELGHLRIDGDDDAVTRCSPLR
jgi:hypothetical protein